MACLISEGGNLLHMPVFSTSMIQSMMGGHDIGGAYGHIKDFEFSLIPTSKESPY